MFRVGLSAAFNDSITEDFFINCQKVGITDTEISTKDYNYKVMDYETLLKWSKKYSVNIWSYHIPFSPFSEIDPSATDTAANAVKYFTELMEKAAGIGVDKFVIHASGEPMEESDRASRMECSKDSLYKLACVAEKLGAVLAVEDLPRTCLGRDSSDILELISVHDNLKVCFDTNHLLKEKPVDFIKKVGDKIITTHVSDYDFTDEMHWLPGEGLNDWQGILKALKEVNYSGVWMYEIPSAPPRKITRAKQIDYVDFVENAKNIFAGKI